MQARVVTAVAQGKADVQRGDHRIVVDDLLVGPIDALRLQKDDGLGTANRKINAEGFLREARVETRRG